MLMLFHVLYILILFLSVYFHISFYQIYIVSIIFVYYLIVFFLLSLLFSSLFCFFIYVFFCSQCSDNSINSSENLSRPSDVLDAKRSSTLIKQWSSLVQETYEDTKCHIMAVLTAMCRLLAHKVCH